MMTYEIFKKVVQEKIYDYLPPEFLDMKVNVFPVNKVNRTKDGLSFKTNPKDMHVAPTIYLDDLYEEYLKNEDLSEVLSGASECICKGYARGQEVYDFLDFDSAQDKIVFQLINTEQNQSYLKNIPHREFQDLSIIYRWVLNKNENGIISSVVTKELAEKFGMNEELLYRYAVKNTKELLPVKICAMDDLFKDMLGSDMEGINLSEDLFSEMEPKMKMYVISNEARVNGAASMLYEQGLHELAEKLESDLYILPSSIHEVLAVSAEYYDEPYELAEIVNQINMNEVSLEERLSNQVYHYNKDLRQLTMATKTPNKRLDGIVAEPPLMNNPKEQSR